jgi:hypothetical protein
MVSLAARQRFIGRKSHDTKNEPLKFHSLDNHVLITRRMEDPSISVNIGQRGAKGLELVSLLGQRPGYLFAARCELPFVRLAGPDRPLDREIFLL